MGVNTLVLIRNDRINDIKNTPILGQLLYEKVVTHNLEDIHIPGIEIVAQHHADVYSVILMGGNSATEITPKNCKEDWIVRGLKGALTAYCNIRLSFLKNKD